MKKIDEARYQEFIKRLDGIRPEVKDKYMIPDSEDPYSETYPYKMQGG